MQFPFMVPIVEEKTAEELARMAEKRKEQGKKLQEMAAEKRREKVGTLLKIYSHESLTFFYFYFYLAHAEGKLLENSS